MTSDPIGLFEGFSEVGDREFYEKVISAEKPSVVLFVEPGNPANRELAELMEGFVEEYGDRVNFFLVDVSRNMCHEDFGVFSFPALIYFRESMELDRHDFVPTRELMEEAIRRILRLT